LSLITRGASLGMEVYWRILSTDIILFSKLQRIQIKLNCAEFRLIPYVTANPAMPSQKTKILKQEKNEVLCLMPWYEWVWVVNVWVNQNCIAILTRISYWTWKWYQENQAGRKYCSG
jgi:hypothetical protein